MKILTSYFYQIRNFKPYQIPLSTAISDPAWYHPKMEIITLIRMVLSMGYELVCCSHRDL